MGRRAWTRSRAIRALHFGGEAAIPTNSLSHTQNEQCLIREVAVVVAHPDDETIWVGGTLLMERDWNCRILGLCRAGDSDRAPKFQKAIASFNADR